MLNDKTPCPDGLDEDALVETMERDIAASIARGWHAACPAGSCPRYVWGRSHVPAASGGRQVELTWEARVTNEGVPEYKAYPVTRDRAHASMPYHVRVALWP